MGPFVHKTSCSFQYEGQGAQMETAQESASPDAVSFPF